MEKLVILLLVSNFNNISKYETDVEHLWCLISRSLACNEPTYEWNWLLLIDKMSSIYRNVESKAKTRDFSFSCISLSWFESQQHMRMITFESESNNDKKKCSMLQSYNRSSLKSSFCKYHSRYIKTTFTITNYHCAIYWIHLFQSVW
jgi:hypothetical protein